MKNLFYLLTCMLFVLFFSCTKEIIKEPVIENEPIEKESITGFVQKGPFAIGTSVTVAELDSYLAQSGRNFNTQITNNNGHFKIENIVLNNSFVEIKADGFYYNEVRGKNSENRLTLYSLSDLTDKSTINVNVLSYLEKARIEYLVEGGKSFADAKKQAQKEVLAIFEVENANIANSEELDISKSGGDNAILLAISVILQGKRSVAELSELLAKISIDIREDGVLDDKNCGSDLINHAKLVDLPTVRSNIENKYYLMGSLDSIPEFERIIENFIEKTGFVYTLNIEYPRSGKYGINILSLEDGETIRSPAAYSIKALMPEGFNLKVRITRTSDFDYESNYGLFYLYAEERFNFKYHSTSTFGKSELTSTENATEAEAKIQFEGKGSGLIEIFENGEETPTKTIHFDWNSPPNFGITYRLNGSYGENLFKLKDNSTLKRGETYSMELTLPEDLNLDVTAWIVRTSGTGTIAFDKNLVENWSVNLAENKAGLNANCSTPGLPADMPVVFNGTGECTLELRANNSNVKTIIFKHFKW